MSSKRRGGEVTIKILRYLIAETILPCSDKSFLAKKLTTGLLGEEYQSYQKRYLASRLDQMEKEEWIDLGGERVVITEKGKDLLRRFNVEQIELFHDQKWNGIWHLIAYDIPNEKSQARDRLRKQLRDWGLFQIQKSVWVSPYECKQELAVVAQEYCISQYVLYLNATDLPMATQLKEHFCLAS